MRFKRCAASALLACYVALQPTDGSSQTNHLPQSRPGEATQSPASTDSPAAAPSKTRVQVPIDQTLLLVRSTLMTLNDANHSGNYTVLRDLASQEFQAKNTSADLSLVFAEMRRSNLNLFSVLLLSPQLSAAPAIDSEGRLRVSGYVPTSPQQLKFDLVYESSTRRWKLLSINISTTPVQAANPPAEQQQEPKKQAQSPKPKAAVPKNSPLKLEPTQTRPAQAPGPPPQP